MNPKDFLATTARYFAGDVLVTAGISPLIVYNLLCGQRFLPELL